METVILIIPPDNQYFVFFVNIFAGCNEITHGINDST